MSAKISTGRNWENDYETERDAETLGRHIAIKKDPARLAKALKHIKSKKHEHVKRRDEAAAMVKLADKGK